MPRRGDSIRQGKFKGEQKKEMDRGILHSLRNSGQKDKRSGEGQISRTGWRKIDEEEKSKPELGKTCTTGRRMMEETDRKRGRLHEAAKRGDTSKSSREGQPR